MGSRREEKRPGGRDAAGRLGIGHLVCLLVLLIPTGLALQRLSAWIDYRWLLAYALVISLTTYALYGADKDSARDKASKWRAPEKLLHAFEFAGGWPGAFLAQHQFRHKTSKTSYQVVFWLIVFLHIGVAADYDLDWRFARATWRHVLHAAPPSPAAPAPDAGH
jgi:uncharacterized membrane protein YsdA (DUF1294 family)